MVKVINLAVSISLLSSILLIALPIPIAHAQSESFDGLEEIIVTALRHEKSLQETPISIAVFVADDFEKLTVRNVADVIRYTPNVVTTSGPTGHNDGFYFIRGIGNVDLNPATDPGVGTYIDGVYLGRITGANIDALNIERVEVLRGPQGTLFGRNTIGGAISIITRSPSDEAGGNIKVTVGDDNRFNVRASVDIPFSENFGATFSVISQNKDGRGVHVDTGQTFGDIENLAGRAKFVWQPSDSFRAELAADHSKTEGTSAHNVLVGFNPMAVSPLGVPMPFDLGDDRSSDIDVNFASIDPVHDTEGNGVSVTLDLGFGSVDLKMISAYRDIEQFDANDFDQSRYTFYDHSFYTDEDQFSQEIQFLGTTERLDWVFGAYYFDESAFHNNAISMGGNNGVPPGIPMVPYATRGVDRQIKNNQRFTIDIKSYAAFAHLTYEFSEKVSGTLGIRWTDEEKEQNYDFFINNEDDVFNFAMLPPIPYLPTLSPDNPFLTIPTTYRNSWSEITPKLGLDYRFSEDVFGYFTYSRGFRSGGYNGRPNPNQMGVFPEAQPYDPEVSDSYEIGLKTQLRDDTVRLNVSAFFTDYQDIQLLVLGSSGFFETENAAEAELKGIELELTARTANDFELIAGIGYLDTEYTRLDPGTIATGITLDKKLANAPELTLNLGLQKGWRLSGGSSVTVRADYIWQDDVFFNATNLPGEFQESYGVLNARIAYRTASDAFEIAAYGLNIADEDYFVNGQDVVGPLGVAFMGVGPAAEFGIEASYSFGSW